MSPECPQHYFACRRNCYHKKIKGWPKGASSTFLDPFMYTDLNMINIATCRVHTNTHTHTHTPHTHTHTHRTLKGSLIAVTVWNDIVDTKTIIKHPHSETLVALSAQYLQCCFHICGQRGVWGSQSQSLHRHQKTPKNYPGTVLPT